MQIDLNVRGWIGAFATLAAYAIPISSRTMSFPVDSVGGNLRQPPLPKTKRIIALLPPKSNRKAKLLSTARLSHMRAFFAHTSLQVVFTSCPSCFQIIMQEKHSYAHGDPLRTSHIAICDKQKPIPHNRSTNPKAKQYHIPHPKPIQSLKMSHSSCASYSSYWRKANRKAINPSQTIAPKTVDLNSQLPPSPSTDHYVTWSSIFAEDRVPRFGHLTVGMTTSFCFRPSMNSSTAAIMFFSLSI